MPANKPSSPSKSKPPVQSPKPEDFAHFWTEELSEAWNKLNAEQRAFLLAWYRNGFHGTNAYKAVYNPKMDTETAATLASRLLSSDRVYIFRKAIQEALKPPLEDIRRVFEEAMTATSPVIADGVITGETPNHAIRLAAVEKMAKFYGFDKPQRVEVKGEVKHAHTVDAAALGPIAALFNLPDPTTATPEEEEAE